jgi:hypothetical protein
VRGWEHRKVVEIPAWEQVDVAFISSPHCLVATAPASVEYTYCLSLPQR